jgi:GTP-binding protein
MKSSEMFIDEATISVLAGDGGDGCVHLHREKYVPRGGPDGGDGGRGGDVVLLADRNLATLLEQRMRRENRAESGAPGGANGCNGRGGADLAITVPVGTIVYEITRDGERLLVDLKHDGDRYVVARGGRGGRGNSNFATPTRQTPDFAERGRAGAARELRLSLKLLADVGLVGFPNAGKSTLLRSLSAARPRVAAYPFTTLIPQLGVAACGERRFVVADIPGLIEGASEGAGLGDRFLRHIERTRVIVHLLDAGAALLEERDLIKDYDAIRTELEAFEPGLLEQVEIIALNKVDLVAERGELDAIEAALRSRGRQVVRTSGATGEGVDVLLREIVYALDKADAAPAAVRT